MNEYNCIQVASNLKDLEKEYNEWLQLPFDLRKRADDYCQLYYGCTNTDLYNNIKAILVRDNEQDDDIQLESYIRENKNIYKNYKLLNEGKFKVSDDDNNPTTDTTYPIGYTIDGKENPRLDKIIQSKEIMKLNSNIIIIFDFIDDNQMDYSLRYLEDLYNRYITSSPDHRNESNSYSVKIWNRTVPFMYEYMKSKINSIANKDEDHDDTKISSNFKISDSDRRLNNYWDKLEDDADKGDVIQSTINQIDCLIKSPNRTLYEYAVLSEGFFDKIEVKGKTYQQGMPEIVPFLTYDEYVNDPDGQSSAKLDRVDPFSYVFNYMDNQKKALGELREAWKNKDKAKLLEMGWNPYIEPTPENIKYARNKQINWLNEYYGFDLYDLSDYSTNLTEEVLDKSLFNMDENQKLVPVYIVSTLKRTDVNGGLETAYINPGLAFDPYLVDIFTFNNDGSLKRENINEYCGFTEDNKFGLFVVFMNANLKKKIQVAVLKSYRQREASYDYKFYTNSTIDTNPQFIFGQFINKIFNLSGLDFNNVNFKDIVDIKRSSVKYNMFMIYKGTLSAYYPRYMELKVKNLMSKNGYNALTFFKPETVMDQLSVKLLENFDIKTSDDKINGLLTQLREALKPKDMFNSLPKTITVDDLYKEYLDQHAVLKASSDNTVDGIKRAVEKLYGIKSEAEAKAKFVDVNESSDVAKKLLFIIENARQDCFTYEKILK